jgi:diguanylate cyclase (GGDEF)-like protein
MSSHSHEGSADRPILPVSFQIMNQLAAFTVEVAKEGVKQAILAETFANSSRELSAKAAKDALTGLENRSSLEEQYKKLQNQYSKRQPTRSYDRRNRNTVIDIAEINAHAILALDLDFFKLINDTQGHNAGDEVLKDVAGHMKERFRSKDILGRWGGEEFCVILPGTTEETAVRAAESIRERIQEKTSVTVSVGVAAINLEESLAMNFARADEALYAAKQHGRNQVVRHIDLTSTPNS